MLGKLSWFYKTLIGRIEYATVDNFISKILTRRMPGVRIDPTCIGALSRDIQLGVLQSWNRKLAVICGAIAARIVGIEVLAHFRLTETKFSQLERKVLTLFILGSNLLDVGDPTLDLVTYFTAAEPCPNRFARYDS